MRARSGPARRCDDREPVAARDDELIVFHQRVDGLAHDRDHVGGDGRIRRQIVRDDPISDADMEKILWQNAARLWKIDTTRLAASRKLAA